MRERKKDVCDYCGRPEADLRSTPFMADMHLGVQICRECWDLSRDDGLMREGINIGPFDPSQPEVTRSET
jgi:hypothetical protein